MISACRNVGVIGSTAASYFIPIGIESIQLISILVFIVKDIIQRTIFNHYIRLIIFQYNLFLGGNTFFENTRLIVRLYQSVVDVQFIQNDGGNIRVSDYITWIEERKTIVACKEYPVVRKADTCARREFLYLYAAFLSVIDDVPRTEIKVGNPIQSSEPQCIVISFHHFAHLVVQQAVIFVVGSEFPGGKRELA